MKYEKGITTSSVIIYVIAITVVIGTFSVISANFYNSIRTINQKNSYSKKYTEFVSYFAKDVQEDDNKVIAAGETTVSQGEKIEYIKFKNGNIYKYSESTKTIYKNDSVICDNIDTCNFSYTEYDVNKGQVTVEFKSGSFDKTANEALVFYTKK